MKLRPRLIVFTLLFALIALASSTSAAPQLGLQTWTCRNMNFEQVVAFGTTLHVSGRNAAALEASLAAVRDPRHEWKKIRSGLEDVFISLMDSAKDNFA